MKIILIILSILLISQIILSFAILKEVETIIWHIEILRKDTIDNYRDIIGKINHGKAYKTIEEIYEERLKKGGK